MTKQHKPAQKDQLMYKCQGAKWVKRIAGTQKETQNTFSHKSGVSELIHHLLMGSF
jgi:hypothetical protein